MTVNIEGNTTSGTTIGYRAFYGSTIDVLRIGDGVTTIEDQAFWNCPNLTYVYFDAINCTSMETVDDLDNHYSVFNSGSNTTTGPAITALTIGDNVTRIPAYAFYEANHITSVAIPSSVQDIENYAFENCSGINTLTFASGSQLVSIGFHAFYGCTSMSGNLVLPDGLNTMGGNAFARCKFNRVVIPASTTDIGAGAFYQSGSSSGMTVNIVGNTISGTTIGASAFYGSTVNSLSIGEGVTSIGDKAFWKCPLLTDVHFNAVNCTSMQSTYNGGTYSVFNSGTNESTYPAITTLTIGENVTNIPDYAFYNCQTASVQLNIPNVTAVGDKAFYNCLLATDLNLGNNVVTIGMDAFRNCNNITGDLVIPNTTTFIGASAFYDTGLNGVLILGQNVNSLGAAAFKNCNFTSIIIGKGDISEPNNITTAEVNTFEGVRSYIPVYRPYGTNYPTATGWSYFTNYVTEYQHNGGAWSVPSNWSQQQLPGTNDVVRINGNSHISANESQTVKYLYIAEGDGKKLTIFNNAKLTVTDGLVNDDASKLVINDGGQLYNPSTSIACTMKKSIDGYQNEGNRAGWYAIASPLNDVSADQVTVGDYDLYSYSEMTHYWKNQKDPDNTITKLMPRRGYLYANKVDTELALQGELEACGEGVVSSPIYYTVEAGSLAGLNFIGNPFSCNAYLLDENGDIMPFYRMNDAGNAIVGAQAGTAIKPCEGVFVLCPNDRTGHSVTFTITNPGMVGNTPGELLISLPSHNLLDDQDALVSTVTQNINLVAGWNWFAPNVETSVGALQSLLGNNAVIQREEGNTNETVAPGQMVKIHVDEEGEFTLTGLAAAASITIENGINWIGFTNVATTGISATLDMYNIIPAEGDKIVSQDQGFAIYNGTSWEGTLTTLEPGKGYVYIR